MTPGQFHQLLSDPYSGSVTPADLETSLQQYPWCQPLQIVNAVVCQQANSANCKDTIHMAAVHTFSRQRLEGLLSGMASKTEYTSGDLASEIFSAPLPIKHGQHTVREEISYDPIGPSDEGNKTSNQRQIEMLDAFLKKEAEGTAFRRPKLESGTNADDDKMIDLSASADVPPVETEAMAMIYLRQGKRAQAYHIFQRLMIQNPEKSAYFAQLLEDEGLAKGDFPDNMA